MKIPPVKGTRDFYPPDMARRNWIIDGWKKVSVRNGFEEYDGPIFEYLKMFQIKSGDEIVEQLFSLEDRGGRELALRPEITPTLARMVNQQISSLPKPIKWFSVPRLFRAERPQRGRLREFFQWNIDIIGEDDVLADAEVIFCTLDYLREVGLTPDDIVVKISSRKLLAALLKKIGISEERLDSLYPVLDKKDKLPPETFTQMLIEQVPDPEMASKIQAFMETVYEIYDRASELRAIGGGGRYDNLLRDFGGPDIPATGLAIGDCILGILLEEKGLFKPQPPDLDYFVACVDKVYRDVAVKLTMKMRSAGFAANFSYKSAKLSKQLKQASEQNARRCVIIGSEIEKDQLIVKNMANGEQELINFGKFIQQCQIESK